MLHHGVTLPEGEPIFKDSSLEEWKYSVVNKAKRWNYVFLVIVIRIYFRIVNLIKLGYQKFIAKIKSMNSTDTEAPNKEKKEVSRFLKMVLEYKSKIRKIKRKIKEEERDSI
jgi:hypothetical protein